MECAYCRKPSEGQSIEDGVWEFCSHDCRNDWHFQDVNNWDDESISPYTPSLNQED